MSWLWLCFCDFLFSFPFQFLPFVWISRPFTVFTCVLFVNQHCVYIRDGKINQSVSIHWSAKARWKCFGRAAVNQFWKEIELHRLWNVCICKIRSVSIVDPVFICLETWPTQKMWHSLILSKLVWLKFTLCYSLMSLPTCCFKSVKHHISYCT